MSGTYFLVRRNLTELLGPWDLLELKLHFEKMTFGKQDEISGHCGDWILIEQIQDLRNAYPAVYESLFALNAYSKFSQPFQSIEPNLQTRKLAIFVFLIIAVATFVLSIEAVFPGGIFALIHSVNNKLRVLWN